MTPEEPLSPSRQEEERLRHAPAWRYGAVWAALAALTFATWALHLAPLGRFHLLVALAIAGAKGTLVALFFMHLREQRGAARLVLGSALVFVALLIGLTLADDATRFPLVNPPHGATVSLEPPGARPRPERPADTVP